MMKDRGLLMSFIINQLKRHPHLKFDDQAGGMQSAYFVSKELNIKSPEIVAAIFYEIFTFEILNRYQKIDLQLFVGGGKEVGNQAVRAKIFDKAKNLRNENWPEYWNLHIDDSADKPFIYKYHLLTKEEYNNSVLTEEMKQILINRLNDFKGNYLPVIEDEFKSIR